MTIKEYSVSPYILPGCRLGNIMFVVAAVYAHSLRNNLQVKVPWEENDDCILLRNFIGGEDFFAPTKGAKNEPVSFTEKENTYCIPKEIISGGISGYFQSCNYFEDCREEITSLYAKFIDYKEPNTLGIHIRMGDYLVLRGKYWVTNRKYLINVSKQISTNISKIVIFSDDSIRALKLVRSIPRFATMKIEVDNSTNPCYAIKRMTMMDELVLASSSFSWWGAYLGSPSKVFAPKDWYIHSKDNQHLHIHHPDWIKVPNLSLFDKLCRIQIFARLIVKLHFFLMK